MDLLQGQLTEGVLEQLSRQFNNAPKEQTQTAASVAMSTLMNALAKNTRNPQSLEGLMGALSNDHDGSILDNIGDLLSGTQTSRAADGMGILGHLLGGNNLFNVIEMISKSSGLNRNNSMSMLMKVAPIVLGVLGRQKKQQNMNANTLASFLNQSVQSNAQQRAQSQGLIERILDQDGDGSAMDDIASMGMKMLGNMFRK